MNQFERSASSACAPSGYHFGLAPMEGVTEFGARLWFWLCSAPDFLWTPFLRVTNTFPGPELPPTFVPELGISREYLPYPTKVQFMASDRDDFLRAFQSVSDRLDTVDFNCGCPAPKVVGNGGGSSLLADPSHFHDTVRTLAESLGDQRLSVKMRVGFHREDEFIDLLDGIKDLPLRHLTIHGRTRTDRYTGKARWAHMAVASERCAYPIIGSGDIVGWRDVDRIRNEAPQVATTIIGRGALRNPWIFLELRNKTEVAMTGDALIHAIACFALLEEMQHHHFEPLLQLCRAGGFKHPIVLDSERWRDLYHQLCTIVFKALPSAIELELSRKALGRVKMLWSYLRSSLPETFFDPRVLRSRSIGELLGAIAQKWRDVGGDLSAPIQLSHRPELDWVYSGSASTPDENPMPLETKPQATIAQ